MQPLPEGKVYGMTFKSIPADSVISRSSKALDSFAEADGRGKCLAIRWIPVHKELFYYRVYE